MDQERAVNRVLRDMNMRGIIHEDNIGEARIFLNALWVAGFEYFRRTELNHNKREIEYFDKQGNRIASYPSIAIASRDLHIGRGTIDDILYGKSKGRRNTGNYFRYADERVSGG